MIIMKEEIQTGHPIVRCLLVMTNFKRCTKYMYEGRPVHPSQVFTDTNNF